MSATEFSTTALAHVYLDGTYFVKTEAYVHQYLYIVPTLHISDTSSVKPFNGQYAYLYSQLYDPQSGNYDTAACIMQFQNNL